MPPLGIARFARLSKFKKQYKKLDQRIKDEVNSTIEDLLLDEIPNGRRLEKASSDREIWKIRVNYHYRMTFEVNGDIATLRRVGPHDDVYADP